MQSFIHNVAEQLYAQYGDNVSSLNILFPSRRARLFFNDSLATIAQKPLWQPNYLSIDEVMESVAQMRRSDNIRLVAELYKAYLGYHKESFDTFYFWGETLLADFDSIDKYLIDPSTLFINIADLKNLESDLSFLTPEQIEIIRTFWRNFNIDNLASPEKQHFATIWDTLLDIYNDFRARLSRQGMAYQGMLYRAAAERLKAGDVDEDIFSKTYIIAGFNALSHSEQILFDHLQRRSCAQFFWDYDTYYTQNPEQEAGMFLRDNIRRFPEESPSPSLGFVEPKEVVVVAAPSDAMQCKYVTQFINEISSPDKNTAIVLTDENLLLPVLHAIPPQVEKINVTMGYPLRQTPAYTFVERLIELQQQRKKGVFYHSNVLGILNHPYIQAIEKHDASTIAADIMSRQQIYVSSKYFDANPTLSQIFAPIDGWEAMCDYIVAVLASLERGLATADSTDMQQEFFVIIAENIYKLRNTLSACEIDITPGVLFSLLRKVLQSIRVPYEGEPLEGVQVMGILETRNLDFENVVILSVNDDTFPGNLSGSSSFIPYNLRLGYGLPTPQHHEGVFSYYFYRLAQRAKRLHIVYSVKTDDKKTGEPSRYIYQLDYESPHTVLHKDITLNINFAAKNLETQPKTAQTMTTLESFLGDDATRKLSPSSFYNYVECPMKFYFHTVAGLREADEISDEVDLPMFGNILHKAAELIYSQLIDRPDPDKLIAKIVNTPEVERAVDSAIRTEYFKDESPQDFGGNIVLIKDIVCKYLNNCLLKYDSTNGGFTVSQVETWVDDTIDFDVQGVERKVRFGGKIDRLDRLDAETVRVVDYKTGGRKLEFRGVDALFSDKYTLRNPAVLQTMIYSLLINKIHKCEVVPSLYFIRFMNDPNYSPLPIEAIGEDSSSRLERQEVSRFSDYKEPIYEKLRTSLSHLFDPEIPFTRCSDTKTCDYCPYREVCFY